MKKIYFLLILSISLACHSVCDAQSGNIYRFAGNGTAGFSGDGGPASAAMLNNPTDVFEDGSGNFYIADRNNNRVRKVSPSGIITTIAGTGTAGYTGDGGSALTARLHHPNGVAVDATGNIYVADEGNNVIRMINPGGIITTIAGNGTAGFFGDGGLATLAEFDDPQAVAKDLAGNIYVADNNNSRVRMINPAGIISTYAGGSGPAFTVDGVPATSVSLCNIHDVSVDNAGTVYFTNQGCWHFLRISPAGLLYDEAGAVAASYTGDCGPADSADVQSPYGIYPDNLGNVYLCPRGNKRVRKVNTANYITTVAGTGVVGYTGDGGPALAAEVSGQLYGIYADLTGNVYFADADNDVIRTFHSSTTDTVPLAVCFGAADTLSDSSSYGLWESGNTGVATVGSISGIITGVSSGTAIITFSNPACPQTFVVTVALANVTGAEVCAGSMVTLSDATTGGTWSSGNTIVAIIGSGTGIVTGESMGIAPITYVMPSGCTATGSVTVDISPTAILGITSLCQGSSTLLTDAVPGGSWSSSTTGVATIGTDGTVTGMGVGTSTITYIIGTCYVTQVVTVTTMPVAITGNTPICETFTITLNDATGGGSWTSVTTTVATVTAGGGLVTGVSAGTSVISYAIGSCVATTIVTVNTQPGAINGTLTVCEASSTPLTDIISGGTWTIAPTTVATVSPTGVVTGVSAGTATVSYIIGSCYSTAIVTVNPLPNAGAITGILTVCPGATTQLSDATGDAGGTWSSVTTAAATVDATGLVSASTPGTSTISYTVTNSCGTAAATVVVTVNIVPTAGSITGVLTVCPGAITPLTDATGDAGGTWSSTATGVATVSATGVVTGVASGTTTISYTVSNICNTAAATAVVTVNPAPNAGAVTGTFTVCPGATTALTDLTGDAGGTWSSSAAIIATVNATGVVTGLLAGTAIITYKVTNSCGTASATAVVTVNAFPNAGFIFGTLTVCPGATTALTDAFGAAGGTWSSVITAVATISAIGVVTGVAAGTSTISYAVTNVCGTRAATAVVTVNAAPAPVITPVGDTIFCPGSFVMLTANTSAGLTYQWYLGGVAIPGAIASFYTATDAGSYQVLETLSDGCSGNSIPMLVTIDTPVATITTSTGSTSTCSGTPITLNANTGAGLTYQWLLDGSDISGAVSSSYSTSLSGDYSVIVTNGTGCSAISAVITLTISPSPTANVVLSGPVTFCQGGSVSMTADFGADYFYQWYDASGAITGANGQSYTATVSGAYYVIVTNGYGCTATSVVINVVANPLPNAGITAGGPTIFCTGGSVTLNASAGGGFDYQWYVGGSPIAGATNATYLVTIGGGYRVKITDPATGCSDETHADTVVTVVGTPVIIPITSASYCWGSSSLLSTSVSGASGTVTYQWFFNGVAITGANGAMYNATEPGDYTCQISIPGSCTVTTIAVTVTEFPLPDPVVNFSGSVFYTGTYYIAYQWYKNSVMIPGATSFSTPSTGTGDYKVAVTDTNGCQSFSDAYIYSGPAASGVNNVNKSDLELFPNPATDELTIQLGDLSTYHMFTVTNNLGQQVMVKKLSAVHTTIDLVQLPAGVYYITFKGDNRSEVRKFVKL